MVGTIMENEITDRNIVYDGYSKMEEIKIKTQKGVIDREVLRMGNSVCAIVKDTIKNKYIFVSQYRPGAEGTMVEIVAGVVDKNEQPEEAIKRELMEETGYKVDFMKHINDFYTSPGRTDEIMSLFYIEVSEQVNESGGVGDEVIEIVEVEKLGLGGRLFFNDPHSLEMSAGEEQKIMPPYQLIDAKSLIAVMWLENNETLKNMSDVITQAKLRSL